VLRLLILEAGSADRSPLLPVAQALARTLAERRPWQVHWRELADTSTVVTDAVSLVRWLIGSAPETVRKPMLVLLGSIPQQRRVMWALVTAGLRARLIVVLHVPAAEVPFEPGTSDLFRFADLIVTESAFGARAVEQVCAERLASVRRPLATIPPLVDTDVDLARSPARREAIRRGLRGLHPQSLVVGCCLGDAADGRGFQAIQIFRTFTQGLYWTCARCARVTTFGVDDTLTPIPTSTCAFCLASNGAQGPPRPEARLILIEGALAPRGRSFASDGWTFASFRRACGLEGRVSVSGDEGHPLITSREHLLDALSAMDIHFLPHRLADVEPAVLAGCALAVPTVTTRYGAAADIFGAHARLVPPCAWTYTSEGHEVALMDAGIAVQELRSLTESPAARSALGHAARNAMRRQGGDVVVNQWRDHIARLWASA
jgi:hypothetical protein